MGNNHEGHMRCRTKATVVAALAGCVAACHLPTQFKSVDQARGTLLVTSRLLAIGPACARSGSSLRFDLDRARVDEADAIRFMKSRGQPEDQIEDLRGQAIEAAATLTTAQIQYPEQFAAMCDTLGQLASLDRYKVGPGRTDELPRSVTEVEVQSQERAATEGQAAVDQAQAQANSAEQEAVSAARDALASEQRANRAMHSATSRGDMGSPQ